MATKLSDGTLLIEGAVDGFSQPLFGAKRVKSIQTTPTLVEHLIEHGRPATQSHADRQETIKQLIREMQTKTPSLTFQQAWTKLQQQKPELFGD